MLAKTENRSVLGSMNDMVNMSKFHLDDPDVSPYEMTGKLNRTPFRDALAMPAMGQRVSARRLRTTSANPACRAPL